MVNIPSILATNGAGMVLLLVLLFNTRKKLRYSLLDDKVFYIMLIIDIAQCVIEPASFIIIGKMFPGSRFIAAALNSALFINNVIFAFSWVIYVDLKLFSDKNRLHRIYRYASIPALIAILLAVANLFTPVYFRITENNIYERVDYLSLIPYIITYAYLLYGVFIIYGNKNKANRYLFMPAAVFLTPVVLGTCFQFIFYGLSLVPLSVAIALNSLHINVQNEVSSTDALSGLFTRQYMNQYIDSAIRQTDAKKLIAGIMLDIDKFKTINDTYGHLVGDAAIIASGEILHEAVTADGIAARFAGDEFMVILIADSKEEISGTIDRINQYTEAVNKSEKICLP